MARPTKQSVETWVSSEAQTPNSKRLRNGLLVPADRGELSEDASYGYDNASNSGE